MKDKLYEQLVGFISTRFTMGLVILFVTVYLAMKDKISGSEIVTILVSLAGMYIAGRSITDVILKNNHKSKNE